MALFTTNYDNLEENQNSLIPKGTYECIIEDTRPDATPNDVEYLSIRLRIRKDLDKALPNTNGKQHNRIIWVSLWRRKKTGKYDPSDLNYVMKAAGYPQGTQVESWDDWNKKLTGKPVKVTVTITKDDYQGKTTERNQVWANTFRPTDYPLKQAKDPFKNTGKTEQIDDSAIPF